MKYQSNISRLHFVCSTTQTVRDKITLTMRLPIPPLSNVHLMSARTVQECLFTTLLITQPLIVFYVVAPHGSFEPNTAGRSRSVLNRIILAAKRGYSNGYAETFIPQTPCTGFAPASLLQPTIFKTAPSLPGHTAGAWLSFIFRKTCSTTRNPNLRNIAICYYVLLRRHFHTFM